MAKHKIWYCGKVPQTGLMCWEAEKSMPPPPHPFHCVFNGMAKILFFQFYAKSKPYIRGVIILRPWAARWGASTDFHPQTHNEYLDAVWVPETPHLVQGGLGQGVRGRRRCLSAAPRTPRCPAAGPAGGSAPSNIWEPALKIPNAETSDFLAHAAANPNEHEGRALGSFFLSFLFLFCIFFHR